uniref:Uncharacterized protein n=1 Tax=Anthurium amnicola TaxID=1678845 RepID=A0A1D1Z4G8_9ARAE
MSYRYSSGAPYRSWNATALGMKTTEEEKINNQWSQKQRRESYPIQRGKSTRGRGTWKIDNRPSRPLALHRRHTMPNDFQDHNHNYHTNDELCKFNQEEDDNPIVEEPRNLSTSPESDYDYTKENDKEEWDNQNHHETSSINPYNPYNRKYSADNIYRPPKSRSASYTKENIKSNSSSDDGSQSRGYSTNGSKKYELEHHKVQRNNSWERESSVNGSDQVWTHDKYESLESGSDSKDKEDASTPVPPLITNNEPPQKKFKEVKVPTCEFSKRVKPESPNDQTKHPNVITINIRELTKKSNDESTTSQSPIKEDLKGEVADLKVTPNVTPEINSNVTPEVTSEINPKTNPEPNSEVNLEVAPEISEVTPVEKESPLINLDEDDNTGGIQPTHPKISEDILSLDWEDYQKGCMEEQLRTTMRQTIQTSNSHKLDTVLKEFDSLSL